MAFSLVVLLSLIAASFTQEVCSIADTWRFRSFLTCSYDTCMKNKNFVDKRWFGGDKSVAYSMYINMDPEVFDEKLTLHMLHYTSNSDTELTADFFEETAYSHVGNDVNSKAYAAVSTSLGTDLNDLENKNNYVVYGAIDLMNLAYTNNSNPEVSENKVVRFSRPIMTL